MSLTSRSSGQLTATATIVEGRSLLAGITLTTNGAANCVVTIYDNTSAAGTELYVGGCVGANLSKEVWFDRPIQAKNGIHVVLSGTGAGYITYLG